ncbi:MAG: NAD-binding protein, partial [Alphaproteobacteria bacterium]
STLPLADKKREARALAAAGMEMLDCTISGNPRYIAAKTAAIFVGGDKPSFARHRAVLDAITANVTHVGGFGAGRMAKFIAFYLVIAHTQAAAEAFTLATKAGLDPKDFFDAVAGSQASSAMLETRGKLMVTHDYSSYPGKLPARARSFENLAKLAQALGGDYPMLEAINRTLADAEAAGFTDRDVSSVFEYLLQVAGADPADPSATFAFLDEDVG